MGFRADQIPRIPVLTGWFAARHWRAFFPWVVPRAGGKIPTELSDLISVRKTFSKYVRELEDLISPIFCVFGLLAGQIRSLSSVKIFFGPKSGR
jgi:hypothetical protein